MNRTLALWPVFFDVLTVVVSSEKTVGVGEEGTRKWAREKESVRVVDLNTRSGAHFHTPQF
jgi:hypothetical protein